MKYDHELGNNFPNKPIFLSIFFAVQRKLQFCYRMQMKAAMQKAEEAERKGPGDMHSYMIRKNRTMLRQSNPIEPNPIQSSLIQSDKHRRKQKDAANLVVWLSNPLVFVFGKGFHSFLFLFQFLRDDLLKLLLAIRDGGEMGVHKRSHPLITVIYLASQRKLFLFDWSSQKHHKLPKKKKKQQKKRKDKTLKQNPRNAK